jgi:hypothetical protein
MKDSRDCAEDGGRSGGTKRGDSLNSGRLAAVPAAQSVGNKACTGCVACVGRLVVKECRYECLG